MSTGQEICETMNEDRTQAVSQRTMIPGPLDRDVALMETGALIKEVVKLRDGIRSHKSKTCGDSDLYNLLPEQRNK